MTGKGQQSQSISGRCARAWAPASISNLGPGFDCLGVAIQHWGDLVEARHNVLNRVTVGYGDKSIWSGAREWQINTAGVAAKAVLELLDVSSGVDLTITKNVLPGSGVGSSASSAAAAAWAVNLLFGTPLSKKEIISAVLEGEAIASGTIHGDNVLPSLFGGITLSSTTDPAQFRSLRNDNGPYLSICLPVIQVNTLASRSQLPSEVSFSQSLERASSLAILVAAIQDGDWASAGRQMMSDTLVEPVRSLQVPGYKQMKARSLELGAYGFALSGSGPAVFAVCDTDERAKRVSNELIGIVEKEGFSARGLITQVEQEGARSVLE